MRGDHHIVEFPERMALGQRLGIGHVQAGAGQSAAVKCFDQGIRIVELAALTLSDWPAICGVITTLSNFQSAWPLGSGSGLVTSRPAPASLRQSSALTKASVL